MESQKEVDGVAFQKKSPFAVTVLETARLVLRKLSIDDAEFVLELLNESSFLRCIGDKGVRTLYDVKIIL